MRPSCTRSAVFMDTAVTIEVVGDAARWGPAIARAFAWFREVEARCSRFDPDSELRRLVRQPGVAVPVSPVLFEALRVALAVAEASGGAFDPTVGAAMEALGFDREYRSGRRAPSGLRPAPEAGWLDVTLDPVRRTVTLARPLLLDLGGVAKGLAVDLAACELAGAPGFVVEAGGDLLALGRNPADEPWRIGIRHPRRPEAICGVLRVDGAAVCTSGDYARGRHLVDPASGRPARDVASCTVVAPHAVLADALATAASVMGPRRGVAWLRRMGVEGLVITPQLACHATAGLARYASA